MCVLMHAQTDTIRYVHPDGAYSNNGRSWATAKNRVQDAINDLHEYMQTYHLTSGSVYIAAGTYTPTESTESVGGSMLNTSFKIYAGIHVYGGFNPDAPESKPGDRIMSNGKKVSENWSDPSGIGTTSGTEIASQWDLRHKTILSGNHSSGKPTFEFDPTRGRYNTAFPASSYHVVWFATNGKYPVSDDGLKDHFKPLDHPASLDGCVISSGNASSRNTIIREHTAYGGGVYMVGNAQLRNCTVERCCATMRGGGIYCDGGGEIEFCYIITCQSAGVGVVQGYGGGVCIDHGGSIGHSHISSCAARCGGGLMINHVSDEYPTTGVAAIDTISNCTPFATACVINNNTANAEGGGIYLAEGGTVNHCTVTGNDCCGPDVTYYGRRHGRSGGVYIRNCGMIFNSVFWGNRCDANNDIQFASVRQKTGAAAAGFEIFVYHTAFMNHDISDWTGVTKELVFSLEKNNMPTKGSTGNFCCFFKPTVDPNKWDSINYNVSDEEHNVGLYGPGVFQHIYPVQIPGPRLWHLTTYSALDQKGVQWNAAMKDVSWYLQHAHTDYGVVTNPYEPVSTLGALVRKPDPITYVLMPPQGVEGRQALLHHPDSLIPTLFIDPKRKGVYDSIGQFVPQTHEGNSWDTPARDLGEAISYFRRYLKDDEHDNHHYWLPEFDDNLQPTGDSVRYDHVQFLVKEGTVTTVGPGNYLDRNIRTAALRVESHMRLYGGYPGSLTGTDTEGRNPRTTKTIISANITGVSGSKGFANNSAHVVAMINTEHSIVDGFTLSDANTHDVDQSLSANAGGGLLMNNSTTPQAKRINMMGNQLRNCVITNCSSPKGVAVYVNGEWPKADGEICYAELMMVNCVIRNNTADYTLSNPSDPASAATVEHGIITANGRAYVHVEHCTVANNVGFPFKADSKQTESDEPIHCSHPEHHNNTPYYGYIRVDNSLIFCNGDRRLDDRGELGNMAKVMSVNDEGQDYVFGMYNLFDYDLALHQIDDEMPRGFFSNDYHVPIIEGFVPEGFTSHFTDDIGDIPADSVHRHNYCLLTRANSSDKTYPAFLNPSRNVGHSMTGDKPLYGGNVAYVPMTTNPCVNAAHRGSYSIFNEYDRTDQTKRDRGGAPDIGAVENGDLPAAGSVFYVTPDGAGKRDGSSWDNAIAGNTVYRLYGAGPAEGDSIDAANNARLVNAASGDPVLTTDNRYCGGYAMKYIYPVFTDRGRNISRDIEIDRYVGGNNPRIDTTAIDTTNNAAMTAIKYNNGTIPSSYVSELAPDPKYPYGEMSGVSRYIYRAQGNYSPLTEDGKNVMVDGTVPSDAAAVVASGRLVLTNERRENYVSGLQYAVEKASEANKTMHKDSVQVWIGAGKYTDYKGYVMRDSVSVYGGFPAGKYAAPGMQERRALMSAVVAIPKSKENEDLDAEDYETILQISDVNPRSGTGTDAVINPAAIKFTDDSATVKVNILNNVTTLSDHNTVNYYRWKPGTDVSATYMRYPDMWTGSANVFGDRHKINKSGQTANNITMGNEVFGGITWTAGQNVVYQYFGNPWKKTDMGNNQSWELVYEDRENNINYKSFKFDGNRTVFDADGQSLGTVPRGMELGGVMNTMSVWQTMKNVPAGTYQLQVDLGAYYVNSVDETNTGITFYIIDANGDIVAEQPMYRKNNQLVRYTFEFEQPAAGDLTVRIMSTPGTKAVDPATGPFGTNGDGSQANYRRVSMANILLCALDGSGEYVFDHTEEENTTTKAINSTSISEEYVSGTKKNRALLRKRVLQMPDVTSTVYAHGLGDPATNGRGKYSDKLAHYERVIKDGRLSNVKSGGGTVNGRHQDPNYKEYNKVYWDGFTIRHGFLHNMHHIHGGGAGVTMFEGARLVNCIVTDNFVGCRGAKGGGVFCDGCTSTIENCFILNNTLTKGALVEQSQQQGAGLFLYEGTCFNSLIANNWANGPGAGLGLCVGKFYNNTVAYNTSNNGVGGVRVATGSEPAIFMANTIIFGNSGKALSITSGTAAVAPFINCYIQSATQLTTSAEGNFLKALASHTEGVTDGNFGQNNTFLNETNPSAVNTPFAADIVNGAYNASNPGAKATNNFALRQAETVKCINSGEEDFEGAMYKGVREYLQRNDASSNPTDANIKKETFYKNVVGVELPSNDVVYAKRVQDCQVDIGAYEFNAAYSIRPDTVTHPGRAIFYAAYDSPGGDASANSPKNAACAQKFQLVLDAAGRYKQNLMTRTGTVAETPKAGEPDKSWSVEVWLQGDTLHLDKEGNEYIQYYTATRSTKHSVANYHDNTLDYSFIIPHGIQVKGGYVQGYYHYENADGDTVVNTDGVVLIDTTGMDYHIVDDRNPLTFRSILSGKITSSTGAEGQTFHVATFTNDLFSPDDEKVKDDGNQLAGLDSLPDRETHRAVLDGLFLEDGMANAPDPEEQIGAGAVVTSYAHIRNCVVQNNEALGSGGGLYLKPLALVSGTIIKQNTADMGGGMYIEAPIGRENSLDSLARIYASTICDNTAIASGGGMWFDDSYARVNSTAIWHNAANDNANVSGSFTRTSTESDYPFTFCAVESRRLEGQGNIELSPRETEGVRWDRKDPFEDATSAILYYPIEMSSTLSRAGMTYAQWDSARVTYTTLDSTDIAGVSRKRWTSDGTGRARGFAWGADSLVTKSNDFIEIGARALNKNFAINVDLERVMYRLYVMHSELIDSKAARALQDNTNTDNVSEMYRQMGSCILNPFHRLGDAFDYVIAARKKNPEKYRSVRFEIFVEQGTYYPYHNAYGEQGQVRNNTFLIPEAVLLVGGVDSRPDDHKYGQEGFVSMLSNVDTIGTGNVEIPGTGYTINFEYTDSIRLRDDRHRPMRDNNLNSVIEPWELERQTILSGNAVSGEDFTHVYHVITIHADSTRVGPQPYKYRSKNPDYIANDIRPDNPLLVDTIQFGDTAHYHEECDLSILARTVGIDGIQINGGYANHLDPNDTVAHHYVTKTYFRGGGIFVDGNWNSDFDKPDAKIPNVTDAAKYNIPIVVENCYFTNNMAGNGGGLYSNGGIYLFGCHFTQNYSEGPTTKLDQRFIPWTAGGCIATNAVCGVANTLFDNNEARRGKYPIMANNPQEYIPDADARQGFGGCLSVSADSHMRVVNCHFMKNKAVAYSAIYNFKPNNLYNDPDSMQFAFNTIFWGNEVFEVDKLADLDYDEAPPAASEEAYKNKYKSSRAGVFHYDGPLWDRYERLFHEYDSLYTHFSTYQPDPTVPIDTFNIKVIQKLDTLRAVGDSLEGLYFCSYRKGYGPSSMKPTKEGYLMTKEEQRAYVDSRQKPARYRMISTSDAVEDYSHLFSYLHGNNNVLINRLNTATDGPNFKQPTFVAGIDGYMQNADWLLARMNQTTDQGWGHLKQTTARGIGYYITKYTGTMQFETFEDAWAYIRDTVGATNHDVYPVSGLPYATFDAAQHPIGPIYNFYSKRYGSYMSKSNPPLPIGDDYYMVYSRNADDPTATGRMDRISKNPKMGVNDVYIDIGVYEYQYVQLDIKGQEIDTMWVATKEKGMVHDGLSWETPTTDLQAAIDLLMSSHNNHDKYICLIGDPEGTSFSPQNVLDNRRTFLISSNCLDPLMPDSAAADHDYGVKSLTFLGGYSPNVKDVPRDPQAYPTVIEMPDVGNISQRNQLFVVEDMTRQMIQVNWQGEYTSRDSVVIPIVFDGITFVNPYSTKDPSPEGTLNNLGGQMSKKGGAAIYYRWQRRYEGDGTAAGTYTPNFNMALHPDSALIDGRKVTLPKLTISNCIFMENGARTTDHAERSPAVRIDHGGGSSLIVNTLFHSNAGAPVYARTYDILTEENDLAIVPNDVVIINSTSALNDGHIRLESDNSEVHNSLIWLDDLHNDTTIQLQMGSDQWDRTDNKDRQGISGRMTHNAVWGCFQPFEDVAAGDSCNNHPLATDNSDIFKGPGFLSPHVTATTSEQRRERSFQLNPSIRTYEKASQDIYTSRVFFRVYPDTCAATHNKYWRRSNGFKSFTITSLANDSDLASKPRLFGNGMERGAYECLAVLQRVLYVRPELPAYSAGDGSSWERAFGQGQLQNAIDAAAVYTYLNQERPREDRKAYVFVKGSGSMTDHYDVVARDGVCVYGSVPGFFNDTAWIDDTQHKFTNEECHRFVNYVRASTPGVAAPNAPQTKINSIHISGDPFNTGFLLDGFVITNPGRAMNTAPVLIDNEMAAVRNCLIVDNTVPNYPVADIRRGLLYNCLFYNDSADAIVKVGTNGLVLNNTIVADNADVTPLDDSEATPGAVQNNIAGQQSELKCFAPYMTANNPYALPAHMTNTPSLSYQLHERSAMLNSGTMDSALPALFDSYKTDNIINFKWDRDVLGNPRKISSSVDKGALETWYVAKNYAQEITAITNRVPYTETDEAERDTAYTEHFGGHNYPHAGSVVYLMDSSALSMQYATSGDFKDFRDQDIIFNPGYMLLKPGASFYGNGHEVQMDYLAAEKRFSNQRYSMTAFPFPYNTADITVTSYHPANDSLNSQLSTINFNTYQYSGAARSAKDYVFQTTNSSLWLPVDTLNRAATEGYLMDFGATTDTVLRFTAYASTLGQYVYTEEEEDKTVYLTQYDNRTAGSGSGLNFTRQEDMGWNMKGLPWLVSSYRTDTILEEGNYQRQMFIPHVYYQMDGAGEDVSSGDQMLTLRSWDKGATMGMGKAFLTQTATSNAREGVVFHLPYYGFNEKASRPILRMSSGRGNQTDFLTVIPDANADKNVRYSYGRDGMKWLTNANSAQVYLLDSKRQSRISLLDGAPTEVDIPLGVQIPVSDGPSSVARRSSGESYHDEDDTRYTFALPEKEAFAGYDYVWLIDYANKCHINLLEQEYETVIESGQHNDRFALRFGRFSKPGKQSAGAYTVFAHDGTLFIRGLVQGDKIEVYTTTGHNIFSGTASSASEWTMPLFYQAGYIVKVNDLPYKVVNM